VLPDLQRYVQIIDWICDWLKLIFQYEPNEHVKSNNAAHDDRQTSHLDDEKTQNIRENHLFRLRKKGKKMQSGWF